jgi:hypothetical protein
MLNLQLELKPEVEKELVELVNSYFQGSYEKFIESMLMKSENILTKLADISEELDIPDLAENHDHYLYGVEK